MTKITGEIVIDAPADVVFDVVADQPPDDDVPTSGSSARSAASRR